MESNNIKELPEVLELDGLINSYVQSNKIDYIQMHKNGFSYKEIQESFWKAMEAIQKSITPIKDNVSDGWISVENDLPPVNTFVDGYNEKWIDEDFNPDGIRQSFVEDSGLWISANWDNNLDAWLTDDSVQPTHWRQRSFKK